MVKILIAIGCNKYDSPLLDQLDGAVNDATAIDKALVRHGSSPYDKSKSIVLESPTYNEVRTALEKVIYDIEELELTLFFAGHGTVKDGSYFMCVRDTNLDRLSISALSVNQLFMWINEGNVHDSNIIIDACEAGGVANDVGVFLKPNEIGCLNSPSVSILAASAADQQAREESGHGIATSAILKCLSGDKVIHTERPTLSLIEVGQTVSELLIDDSLQAPVSWGLNLFGKSRFCTNPCYLENSSPLANLPEVFRGSLYSENTIRAKSNDVWEFYLSCERNFDVSKFLSLTGSLLAEIPSGSNSAPALIDGLANTLLPLVKKSSDPFEEIELLGACIASLLTAAPAPDSTSKIILAMSCQLSTSLDGVIEKLNRDLDSNSYALVSSQGSIADLYYLPLRVTRILGWVSLRVYIANQLGTDCTTQLSSYKKLVRNILVEYSCSLNAVSDEQAPFFLLFVNTAVSIGLLDEAELVFSSLLHTFHKFKGRIAQPLISGEKAFEFIKNRTMNNDEKFEYCAQPSELFATLFIAADLIGIPEILDEHTKDFDHQSLNLFIPDEVHHLSLDVVTSGRNFTYEIGRNIWSVSDFLDRWNDVRSKILEDQALDSTATKIAALCATLVRPDRTPWFLLCSK